jgi:hypothetical protein
MTIFFKSHQIVIYRPHSIGTNKYNFSATFTAYSADIQPLEQTRANEGGRVGKIWNAWVDPECPVREGDQIVTGGKRYSVKAISYFSGAGLLDHKSLVIESQK